MTLSSPLGRAAVRSERMIHGIAGDEHLIFATEVMNGAVVAYDRVSGEKCGDIPVPDGGFLLPYALRVPRSGRLVVLDPGGFPTPTASLVARVYDYDYEWDQATRTLRARLARTVRFEGLPVGFTEDVEVLDDGTYLVCDSVIGSIWVIAPDGSIRPGMLPSSLAPGDGLPLLAPGTARPADIEGIPFAVYNGFAPGPSSIAVSRGFVYWGAYSTGGAPRMPLATLLDASRSAEERAKEIEHVSPPAPGEDEVLHGLTFNRFDPADNHLYATDPLRLQVVRIDVATGQREVLLRSPELLDFPICAHFVPPMDGVQSLIVACDQEHRFAALNSAIAHDLFKPPFLATEILLPR